MKKVELHPLKVAVLEEKAALVEQPRGQDRKTEGRLTRKAIYLNMILEKIELVERAENDQIRWLRDVENYVKELGKMGTILHREPTPMDPIETIPCNKESTATAPPERSESISDGPHTEGTITGCNGTAGGGGPTGDSPQIREEINKKTDVI